MSELVNARKRSVTMRHDGDSHVSDEGRRHIGYLFPGGVASATSRSVTAPLDRLKVYLMSQTSREVAAIECAKQGSLWKAGMISYRNMMKACDGVWHVGGFKSLWAGNGLDVVKMLPEGAIKFAKKLFASWECVDGPTKISVWAQTASGGLGGVAAQLTAYPIDTLRFRMQCEMRKGGEYGAELMWRTAKAMWRTGGLRAYFRGLTWGLIGQYPYSAIDLTTYEYTKQWWIRRHEAQGAQGRDAYPSSAITAIIGGFSGALGASLVWPLNLLRTRLQTSGTLLHNHQYDGIIDVAQQTIRKEGYGGLFKGMSLNLIKVVPSVAITYIVYEQMKRAFGLP
ncbi:mitochondrial carrier domain-containing protein [Penicillium cinerascens]|uniref:Mitochondrial thiamine pyrophosphate carrier 1 n=1 Tax=Penicillium cinerascens TaxID=70096 RepID=A0A9W9J9Z6_9EURO|nr:mitochondrial carrier domain-containing protein [Penicillium cinerascens]KAJ5192036.1 mitochondrial carrier domain-containing protein [Penicillium cinerascens]